MKPPRRPPSKGPRSGPPSDRPKRDFRSGPPRDARSGPPSDRRSGPPSDRTSGPPSDRPKRDFRSGPPSDRRSGPPSDRPKRDFRSGPPSDRRSGPPRDTRSGPPTDRPKRDFRSGPPSDRRSGPPSDRPKRDFRSGPPSDRRSGPPRDDRSGAPSDRPKRDFRSGPPTDRRSGPPRDDRSGAPSDRRYASPRETRSGPPRDRVFGGTPREPREPQLPPPATSKPARPTTDLSTLPLLRARRAVAEPELEPTPATEAAPPPPPATPRPKRKAAPPPPEPAIAASPEPVAEPEPAAIPEPVAAPERVAESEPAAPPEPVAVPEPGVLPEVRVNRKATDRIAAGHPWIFTSDIADRGTAQPGQPVKVADYRGHPLGIAHYSAASQITLRMLSRQIEEIGREFFLRRLRAAEQHRRTVVHDTDSYRLIHGEADLLPALIVDRYGDYLVMQTLDQGMDASKALIASCLEEIFQPKGIVARNDAAVRSKEELPLETTVLSGEIPDSVAVKMNGLSLTADLLHGQKTGIFLDQRENYLAAARYARGGRALDCFTSTGGFALHMAPKCESVEAVDSSGPALATARANAAANGISNIEWNETDVFDLLSGYANARRQFSTVVLDPPAFAKNRRSVEPAVTAYKEINLRALRLLHSGGILVTCSCSHHLSESDFLELVAQAALDTNRTLRVLERRTQSQDHPILLTVPETLYLKCLVLEVV